jgi:hypothetical protein
MSGKVIGDQIEIEEKEINEENTSFNSEDSNTNAEEFNVDIENEKIKEREKMIKSISYILSEITNLSKTNTNYNTINDIFNPKKMPNISISDYINRIIEYTNIEENTLICALIYIDSISNKKKITISNIYKILFSAVLISIKFNEDEIYPNNFYAQIAGVPSQELLQMEHEFLILINFNLLIDENKFSSLKIALKNLNQIM